MIYREFTPIFLSQSEHLNRLKKAFVALEKVIGYVDAKKPMLDDEDTVFLRVYHEREVDGESGIIEHSIIVQPEKGRIVEYHFNRGVREHLPVVHGSTKSGVKLSIEDAGKDNIYTLLRKSP
ncbi:hypothetical protein CMI45_02990 [Candidatus Pacearchaeota archaeon]|nr:hypothetical protein [Candidatus Pacearchaeota archaeon]MAG38325.1 hypothetical protein [Candidatus Pacearchaeota archaeon]|tara:strand:+ start:658 stop:1023 length:366 start_codon:yes stop_codon:yes gene_type:complete